VDNLLRLAVVVFLAGNSLAWGQDAPVANIPAPAPPFIARAPEQSSWLIDITPAGDAASASSTAPRKFLRAQLWTKSGTALQCANEWSDGTRTEDTVVGPTKFAQSLDGRGVHQYNPKLDPRYHDFSTGDFELLDWITAQNYVGAVTHKGEPCYLFQTKGTAANAAGASGAQNQSLAEINTPDSPTSVYVSIRTGLPVEIDNSRAKYVFQFGLPGQLKMPDATPPPPPPPSPPPAKPKPKKSSSSSASKPAKKPASSNEGSDL